MVYDYPLWLLLFLSETLTPLYLWFLLLSSFGYEVVWLWGDASLKLDTLDALMKSIIMQDRDGGYGMEGNI